MATLVSNPPITQRELTPQSALHIAWLAFLIMAACPFLLFLYAAWQLTGGPTTLRALPLSDRWFLSAVAYMVLVVPASFFVRTRLFKEYYRGGRVSPKHYLTGMLIVWGTLEVGGLYSLTGC